MPQERVQKILAQAGLASRRKAEELIAAGEVTINGQIAKLGDKAEFGVDAIKVQGKLIHQVENPVYLAFHKPRGVISLMNDPEGRPSLSTYLSKINARIFPVGRLDFNSEGLLLLTNDGELAEQVQKNEEILRVYRVKVKGHPDADLVQSLERGARVEERRVQPHSVRLDRTLANKSMIEVAFKGGGQQDVKGLFESRRFLVERMVRTSIGHLTLHGIAAGTYKILKKSQVEALINQPHLGAKVLEEAAEKSKVKDTAHEEALVALRARATSAGSESAKEDAAPRSGASKRAAGKGMVVRPVDRNARSASGGRSMGGDRPARTERPMRAGSGDRPRTGAGFGFKKGPRPSFGGERGARDERAPREGFGRGARAPRPAFGAKRPSFGGSRPAFGSRDRDAGGERREGGGGYRGGFQKREGANGAPFMKRGPRAGGAAGAPRGDRPAFGGGKPSRGPRAQSSFGGGASDRPRRTGFGAGPSRGGFGSGAGRPRPNSGSGAGYGGRPRSGGKRF